MKMKVLVTGAAGFIGQYVVNELLKKEYDVIALVHKKKISFDKRVKVLEGDISDEGIIEQVLQYIGKCSIMIHLAADINVKGDDKTILTNCLGTYHILQLAESMNVERFIYISSIPVIGTPKYLPVTEEHPAEPQTLYHITKYTGEKMVERLLSSKIQKVILRIPSPIGIGMSENNYLSFLLNKCMKNEIIELYGTGARLQNYIDVRDIAAAILCSITGTDSGTFLIAGKKEISNRELAFLCKKITGSSSEIICGKREDPEEKNQWIISAQKALQAFGFSPQYELEETIQWIADSIEKSEQ